MPPVDFAILTLALWALHGKNGAKSQRRPPPLERKSSATSVINDRLSRIHDSIPVYLLILFNQIRNDKLEAKHLCHATDLVHCDAHLS